MSIDKLIGGDDISIHTLTIDTLPKAWIEVEGEKPQGGGCGAAAGEIMSDGSPPKTRLTVIGDQVKWPADRSDLRRFLLRLEGGGGSSVFSNMGPMIPGKAA